jgi:hypothetical protein
MLWFVQSLWTSTVHHKEQLGGHQKVIFCPIHPYAHAIGYMLASSGRNNDGWIWMDACMGSRVRGIALILFCFCEICYLHYGVFFWQHALWSWSYPKLTRLCCQGLSFGSPPNHLFCLNKKLSVLWRACPVPYLGVSCVDTISITQLYTCITSPCTCSCRPI